MPSQVSIGSGGACASGGGTCVAVIDGIFAGTDAERIGLAVHIFKGSGGAPKSVSAALIFKKQ